jgi:hypothetical protein
MAANRKLDRHRDDLCGAELGKHAWSAAVHLLVIVRPATGRTRRLWRRFLHAVEV